MKLNAKIESERGKMVEKSGNDFLKIVIKDKYQDDFITLHITNARNHLQGEHYNVYLQNHKSEYIDIKNGK